MTAARITCDECGGSGKRRLITDNLDCPDCDGIGSWDDEPESCRLCGTVLVGCECPRCDVADTRLGEAA